MKRPVPPNADGYDSFDDESNDAAFVELIQSQFASTQRVSVTTALPPPPPPAQNPPPRAPTKILPAPPPAKKPFPPPPSAFHPKPPQRVFSRNTSCPTNSRSVVASVFTHEQSQRIVINQPKLIPPDVPKPLPTRRPVASATKAVQVNTINDAVSGRKTVNDYRQFEGQISLLWKMRYDLVKPGTDVGRFFARFHALFGLTDGEERKDIKDTSHMAAS